MALTPKQHYVIVFVFMVIAATLFMWAVVFQMNQQKRLRQNREVQQKQNPADSVALLKKPIPFR